MNFVLNITETKETIFERLGEQIFWTIIFDERILMTQFT